MAGAGRKARCPGSGCGYEAAERAVLRHIRSCSAYASAYRADPAAVLDPVEAYRVAHPPTPSAPRAERTAPSRSKSEESEPPTTPAETVGVEVWTWPESLAEQAGR